MMGEIERSPVLAAPSFHNVIAVNSTTNKIDEDEDDFQADEANNLCKRYIPLALKIASKYRDRGVDFEDLRSAAYLGLVQGSRKFDPSRGAFGPYVEHWIAGSVKALFSGNDPLKNAISLTVEADEEGEESHQIDVAAPPPVIAADLSALTDADRHIIEGRSRGETLAEIGASLGLSAERVRQRQVAARSKIRGDQASEAIADLTTRGKFVSSSHHARRWTDFKDREPLKHAYREPQPSREIAHHRLHAPRLAAVAGGSPMTLLTQCREARDALNASLDLLTWSMDLREQLQWGVLDIDEARAEVSAFKRACEQHKARGRRMAA